MSNQQIDNKDCLAPNEVAHGFSEKVMPAKAGYRKSHNGLFDNGSKRDTRFFFGRWKSERRKGNG